MADSSRLQHALAYQFNDPSLLDEALSHRSSGSRNYERLEFLGDSFLNHVIAKELFERRPDDDEGALSRLRSSLVRQATLADIARELKLGQFLTMGPGELRSGGFRRDSILSDVVESVLGAVLIDGGHEHAEALVVRLYGDRLSALPSANTLKDPKTRLQEWLQARQMSLPDYQVTHTSGKDHERQFTVCCTLHELSLQVSATASSRRKAEQASAEQMLEMLRTSATA